MALGQAVSGSGGVNSQRSHYKSFARTESTFLVGAQALFNVSNRCGGLWGQARRWLWRSATVVGRLARKFRCGFPDIGKIVGEISPSHSPNASATQSPCACEVIVLYLERPFSLVGLIEAL